MQKTEYLFGVTADHFPETHGMALNRIKHGKALLKKLKKKAKELTYGSDDYEAIRTRLNHVEEAIEFWTQILNEYKTYTEP